MRQRAETESKKVKMYFWLLYAPFYGSANTPFAFKLGWEIATRYCYIRLRLLRPT